MHLKRSNPRSKLNQASLQIFGYKKYCLMMFIHYLLLFFTAHKLQQGMSKSNHQQQSVFGAIFKDVYLNEKNKRSLDSKEMHPKLNSRYKYSTIDKINSNTYYVQQKNNKTLDQEKQSDNLPQIKILNLIKKRKDKEIDSVKDKRKKVALKSILDVIHKEIQFQKERYYQSKKTEKALMLRGNVSENTTSDNQLRSRQSFNGEMLMTPKLRQKYKDLNSYDTTLDLISFRQLPRQNMKKSVYQKQQFTPWHINEIDYE